MWCRVTRGKCHIPSPRVALLIVDWSITLIVETYNMFNLAALCVLFSGGADPVFSYHRDRMKLETQWIVAVALSCGHDTALQELNRLESEPLVGDDAVDYVNPKGVLEDQRYIDLMNEYDWNCTVVVGKWTEWMENENQVSRLRWIAREMYRQIEWETYQRHCIEVVERTEANSLEERRRAQNRVLLRFWLQSN